MDDYLKIIISVIVAAIGWLVVHYFSTKRDRSLKKRELRTSYLINAYRILANDISHRPATAEYDKKLEDLIPDIQLFGSIEQVLMARNLAEHVANGGRFELDPLINSLRDNLRKELELKPMVGI
jgi:hypothetical protein